MSNTDDELRPEYQSAEMKGAVRGKYAERFAKGTNLVRIDPDLASRFPDERAINDALSLGADIARLGGPANPIRWLTAY